MIHTVLSNQFRISLNGVVGTSRRSDRGVRACGLIKMCFVMWTTDKSQVQELVSTSYESFVVAVLQTTGSPSVVAMHLRVDRTSSLRRYWVV